MYVVRAQGYTVHAMGIPSESEPHVTPLLKEAKRRTGTPVAVGRDFGDGGSKAALVPHARRRG